MTLDPATTDEYLLASSEALLAGTLALMTGQAQASCHEARCLMTHRICSNLSELGRHPALNADFRAAMRQLHAHWCRLDAQLMSGPQAAFAAPVPSVPPSTTLQ